MEKGIIYIILLSIIIIVKVIRVKRNSKKTNINKRSSEALDYNDMIDYITELCISFYDKDSKQFTDEQLVVISTMTYYDEMMNGGLCQFFTNSSRVFAPILSTNLEKINAAKHKIHFDKFIKKNKIDVKVLDSFDSDEVDEFIEQYDKFPFEEYDLEFYDIDSKSEDLCKLIIEYAKNNLKEVFTDKK